MGINPWTGAYDPGPDPDEQVCRPETATGTNINRVVCRSREEADNEVKDARNWRMRNGADPTVGGVHLSTDPFARRH